MRDGLHSWNIAREYPNLKEIHQRRTTWAGTRCYDVLFPNLRLASWETSSLRTDIRDSLMLFLAKGEVCSNYGNSLFDYFSLLHNSVLEDSAGGWPCLSEFTLQGKQTTTPTLKHWVTRRISLDVFSHLTVCVCPPTHTQTKDKS